MAWPSQGGDRGFESTCPEFGLDGVYDLIKRALYGGGEARIGCPPNRFPCQMGLRGKEVVAPFAAREFQVTTPLFPHLTRAWEIHLQAHVVPVASSENFSQARPGVELWVNVGVMLASCWRRVGVMLASCWRHVEACCATIFVV